MGDDRDRVWVDSMPEAYERWLVPTVFAPFARDMARRVAARRPRRVLELAAGTGVLTRRLVTAVPGAEVTATDLNEAMVSAGATAAPGATWRQADALHLPFDAGAFDVVVCQFGVMFFPDKPAAFAEARRVLGDDGALLVSIWDTVDTHDFAAALMAGLARAFPEDPPTFIAAIPHGYASLERIHDDLAAGGLTIASSETITLDGHAESAVDVAVGFCTGTPLRAAIEARGDLDEAVAAVAAEMTGRLGSGRVTGAMRAHLIEAHPSTSA
jgi:SAM-dependent methyltransferase